MTARGTFLRCAGLAIGRGGRRLVEGLALTLEPGSALLVRGPNGAGKSTLLRVLAGFSPPLEGDFAPDQDAEAIAYLGHADGLRPEETVAAHLRFHTRWAGGDPGRVHSALERLGVAHLRDRPARRLSAGQRRRVALARTLASGRPIWLLDEPGAPLDTDGRARLAEVVASHRAEGGSVVAAVHDAFEAPGALTLTLGLGAGAGATPGWGLAGGEW